MAVLYHHPHLPGNTSCLDICLAEGTHTAQDIATLKKFADIMSSASLCGLGETAQSALLSCMKRFPEVFAVKEEVAVR